MKTIKNLFTVVLLVMLATSAFSNPFPLKKSPSQLHKFKFMPLPFTTNYIVKYAVEDMGPSTAVPGYEIYRIWTYLVSNTNQSYTAALTVNQDITTYFTPNGGVTIYGSVTIYNGTNSGSFTVDGVYPPGYTFGGSNIVTLNVYTYNSLPLSADTNNIIHF